MVFRRMQPAQILLVEDDDQDAELIRSVFDASDLQANIERVPDGETALRRLRNLDEFADAPRPDILLLDLVLPGISGMDVLDEVKSDKALVTIPVIMLTQLDAMPKALSAYRHRANSYIAKPSDEETMLKFVDRIASFWLDVAVLPDGSTGTGDG